jgi:hypothetical protein
MAYFTVWALYFGFATSQFIGERRFLSAIKGIAAVVLAQALASIIFSMIAQLSVQLLASLISIFPAIVNAAWVASPASA